MKQRVLRLIAYTVVVLIAGCAQPCFYQAGKSLTDCRIDLLECLRSARPELCMQNRGYRHVDLGKLPGGRKRIKIVARSGEYWAVSGLGMIPENRGVSPGSDLRVDEPQEKSPGRIVDYRVERGDAGTFKVTLVYKDSELP